MLEDKIKEYVISELKNLKSSMTASQNKALKNMQQKQMNATRRLVKGFDRKLKDTESSRHQNLGASNIYESSRMVGSNVTNVFEVAPQASSGGQNIVATKLKEDIQEAVAAENLG